MSLHAHYMTAVGVLFVLVFAIMLHSLIAHRRTSAQGPHRFFGPTGTVQWLWTLVPFAILAFIGSELTDGAKGTPPATKIELAAAQPPAGGIPVLATTPSADNSKPTARDQAFLRTTVLR